MQELEKILEEIDELFVTDIDGLGAIDCNLEGRSGLPCDDCYACLKDVCKDIIRKHMNDGWIPVEEALPSEDDDTTLYIVTDKYGCVYSEISYGASEDGDITSFYKWDDDMWGCFKPKVIAWQPHPEPYRPERSEE